MAEYTYLGPADVFIYGGKEYHQGDSIQMSAEMMEHHAVWGKHRFEGHEDLTLSVPPELPSTVAGPFNEAGELVVEDDRPKASAPKPPSASAGADDKK